MPERITHADSRLRSTESKPVCGRASTKGEAIRDPSLIEPKNKAGAVDHIDVFDRAGLLANEPPDESGLPLV
jgi:hypothetical protein